MTATMIEYLGRLRRIGEGGARASRELKGGDHRFWDGYLQCVADMTDFVTKEQPKAG